MPTTSPRRLISGPPELPGLIATSVWMKGSRSPVSRALALTMPAVTVLSRSKGEPMAITHSPTRSLPTSPKRTVGRPLASILSTATSVRLSAPTTLALNSRLSVRRTMTSSAPSTTWALVITRPSAATMNPEPTPRGAPPLPSPSPSSGWGWPRRGSCWRGIGMPKKRRKNSCISASGMPPPCGPWAVLVATLVDVRMLTTAGPTCSTRSAKSGNPRTSGALVAACAAVEVTAREDCAVASW